ncbi:hypothetical protein HDU90_002216 [Geranomyces variabilis]|nr:hypothetical protein HDU90_002216 [Geranomyces variabilis]
MALVAHPGGDYVDTFLNTNARFGMSLLSNLSFFTEDAKIRFREEIAASPPSKKTKKKVFIWKLPANTVFDDSGTPNFMEDLHITRDGLNPEERNVLRFVPGTPSHPVHHTLSYLRYTNLDYCQDNFWVKVHRLTLLWDPATSSLTTDAGLF